MRDWELTSNKGVLEASGEAGDSLVNNIALSLSVRKGDWWQDTEFGIDWDRRSKLTEASAALYREAALAALKWIKDTGRATSIEVEAERHGDMLAVRVAAIAADGRTVEYETFMEVL